MADKAIGLRGAAVCYDADAVVRDINLEVEVGELHVLLGESGSGKTTLLRAIAGFEPLSSGSLELCGEVVDRGDGRPLPPERRHVGVVFQDYALFPHLDVAGNLAFGQKKRNRDRIKALLESVGLGGYQSRPVSSLSGGEQQRVALARALAQAPRIILFDEPFSNLNRGLRRSLRRQTVELLRELEITSVFVTHDREEAFALADTLSVIAKGNLLASGAPLDLYRQPLCREVATALGDCSFVTGSREGDVISCSLGAINVRGDGETVAVRPADISIDANADGVAATVTNVELIGSVSSVTVRIDEDGAEVVATAAPGDHTRGDEVRVALSTDELPAVQ